MSDDSCAAPCGVGKSAALHPCILKCWYTVDSIKQTKKANWFDRTTERLSESAHELEELVLLGLLPTFPVIFFVWYSALPFLKCSGQFS